MTEKDSSPVASMRHVVEDCRRMLAETGQTDLRPVSAAPIPTLLEQVNAYLEAQRRQQRPAISSLHHFACVGGTLIARCIAAMPLTHVLSEVDPLSTHGLDPSRPTFAPTDLLRHLRYCARPVPESVILDTYRAALETLEAEFRRSGARLVVRDHNHSHYCTATDPESRPSHLSILSERFDVHGALTVRDPVESYISLVKQGWDTFAPAGFDEYCRRYLLFLDAHQGLPIFRYEDFLADPEAELQALCRALDLEYTPGAPDLIAAIRMTGDSGRTGRGVAPRAPKPRTEALDQEIEASGAYQHLCARLGY